VSGDPNVVHARGRGRDFCRGRLLNDDYAGWRGIIVQGKSKVKSESKAAVSERDRRDTGKKTGAE
jgi:hypothetical protein